MGSTEALYSTPAVNGAGTLKSMQNDWDHDGGIAEQVERLCAAAAAPGISVVRFRAGGDGEHISWDQIERWTRSRAVTVAEVTGRLASPGLDFALCSDLVYLRPKATLWLSTSRAPPSPGVIWALGRAGRGALYRGLMEISEIEAADAIDLGLANRVISTEDPLPLPDAASIPSLTTVRDLMRAGAIGAPGLALELASFRLLFASGDPNEGARAFLEKRKPKF